MLTAAHEIRACWEFLLNPVPTEHLRPVPRAPLWMLTWLIFLALGDFWIGTLIGILEAMGALEPFPRDWESVAQHPFQRLWTDPFTFSLFPMVDEIYFRLWLVYPSEGLCLLWTLMPTLSVDNHHLLMACARLGIVVAIVVWHKMLPGNFWCRLWKSRYKKEFPKHLHILLHFSTAIFAGAECCRLGPDLLVCFSTMLKGYVLAWICASRGWWASVIMHAAANLCSDSIAWLYKDIFGIGLHYTMLLASMVLLMVLFFSLLPPELAAALRYFAASMVVSIFTAA